MISETFQIHGWPAVLSSKLAHAYCGGRPAFEELLAKHGDILVPLRRTERGDTSYRRATIDAALAVAEQSQTLVKSRKIQP